MIRVVIADDHTIVREGLQQLLGAAADIEVVGEARRRPRGARARARRSTSTCCCSTCRCRARAASSSSSRCKPRSRSCACSCFACTRSTQYAVRAIRPAPSGYLTKDSAGTQLVDRDPQGRRRRRVHQRRSRRAARARRDAGRRGPAARAALRPRVPGLPAARRAATTVTDIAAQLNLSVKTVSTHKARLMEKLGIDNQADLVRYAMKHGLSGRDA